MKKLIATVIASFIASTAYAGVHLQNGDPITISSVTASNLAGGGTQCLQANNSGQVSGTGAACGTGSGGGSNIESFDGTVRISSATTNFTLNGTQFIGALVGGATASYSLDSSTVTLLGPSIGLTNEVTGALPVANGGTNLTAATDDNTMVGNGTTWQAKALPSCSNATTSKLLYDTSSNAFSCGTDQDSGAGSGATSISGLTDLQASVTGATATVKTGRSVYLDSTGLNASTSHGEATITKQAGTDTGTFRIAVDYNSGSPQLKCYYGTGISIGNYTLSNISCASGNAFLANDFPLATMDVSGGTLQTPTDLRGIAMASPYTNGTGLSLSGNEFSADSAVVSFLAVESTFTAKQHFTSSNTYAGLNVGAFAGNPSPRENGDLWYNSTANQLTAQINGSTVSLSGGGGTPGGSNTHVQFNNSGSFGGDAGLTWNNTSKWLTSARSNASGIGSRITSINNASGPNLGQYSVSEACIENTLGCHQLVFGYFANADGLGSNYYWSQLRMLQGSDYYQVIGKRAQTDAINIGGSINTNAGWLAVTSTGISRFGNAVTAGIGLAPILVSTTTTGNTGDVAASNLLAGSHTSGSYRVCGTMSITSAGTGTVAAWTLSWRSPASGSDLVHDIFWTGEVTPTITPVATAADEFHFCKVINSTGTSAIAIDPGSTDATYTVAYTVERLR